MQKVVFDIEDRPPASYYQEMAKLKLVEASSIILDPPPEPTKPAASKIIDKSEWCKAPEFVPRRVQVPPSGHARPAMQQFCPQPQPQPVEFPPPQPPRINAPMMCGGGGGNPYPQPVMYNLMRSRSDVNHNLIAMRPPHPYAMPSVGNHPMSINMLRSAVAGQPPHQMKPVLLSTQSIQQLMAAQRAALLQYGGGHQRQPAILKMAAPGQSAAAPPILFNNRPAFPTGLPTNLPNGYTANMTTINSLNGRIPAIVLKKKRKKKPRMRNSMIEISGDKTCTLNNNTPLSANNNDKDLHHYHDDSKESSPEDFSFVTDKNSDSAESIIVEENENIDNMEKNGNFFPADLDLIQTTFTAANNCNKDPSATGGSWPDLSEPQREVLLNQAIMTSPLHHYFGAYYENQHGGQRENADSPEDIDGLTESVHLLSGIYDNDRDLNGNPLKNKNRKSLLVHANGFGHNATKSELLDQEDFAENGSFIPYRFKTISLPDVHLITARAQRVCCSIM